MTEIGLFSTKLSNTAPSIGGLLQDKIEESPSYTISSHLYTTGTGEFVDRFEPFERFECHTGFELCTVLFPLCRHRSSPPLPLLLTQHSILITCPVFGVHYSDSAMGRDRLLCLHARWRSPVAWVGGDVAALAATLRGAV